MSRLLIEIRTEEIPAGYIQPALTAFADHIAARLTELRIEYGQVTTFGTPRRLALQVDAVALRQPSMTSQLVGPPVRIAYDEQGQPTVAAVKFAEKAGVPVARLSQVETEKGVYLCAQKHERGQMTAKLLSQLLPEAILKIPFPKSMRWADLSHAFARPIHGIVALLGDRVISFTLGNIRSGRFTYGHAFNAPKRIRLGEEDDYVAKMKAAKVLVDIESRQQAVADQVTQAARSVGGEVYQDPALLALVTNLVETPVACAGRFEEDFLELPREILITSMREHQKYFAVVDAQSNLKSSFIAVNNTEVHDLDLVAAGHERVLRARLSDARFFYEADLKEPVTQRLEKLSGVLFQAKLGSMKEKCARLEKLARHISTLADLEAEEAAHLVRAAGLCKNDLVSQVVVEFPKLQGIMGRIYAQTAGEPAAVSVAIEEHYRPTYSGGALPTTRIGNFLSIVDKIDSIGGCFSIGLVPTGAADPYALRRQAIGILQIMRSQQLSFPLRELIRFAVDPFGAVASEKADETVARIETFFQQRLSGLLMEEGHRRDVVAAVIAAGMDPLPHVWQRIEALTRQRSQPDFDALAVAFKRVGNILRKAGIQEIARLQSDLFQDDSESALFEAANIVSQQISDLLPQGRFDEALRHIAGLRPAVDRFFDDVMVMDKDPQVRANRLALLARIEAMFATIADFSKLST